MLKRAVARLSELPEQMAEVRSRLSTVESRLGTVESQVVQLRNRMENGFSAIQRDSVKLAEMIDERFVQTNTQMRVLHEKLVSDIALLHEGRRT